MECMYETSIFWNYKWRYERICINSNALQINHHNKTCNCLCLHLNFIFLYCGDKDEKHCSWKMKSADCKKRYTGFFVAQASKKTLEESDLKATQNEKQHQTHARMRKSWQMHNCSKDSGDITTSHTFFILLKLAFNKRTVWSSVCSWWATESKRGQPSREQEWQKKKKIIYVFVL